MTQLMRVRRRPLPRPRQSLSGVAGLVGGGGGGDRRLLLARGRLRRFANRAIDNAEREILVGAYGLTTGSGVVEALIRAKERGIDVRLIADKTTPCERKSGVEALATAGVPIWIDDRSRIAHAKTMVIDGAVTLTGSYNGPAVRRQTRRTST